MSGGLSREDRLYSQSDGDQRNAGERDRDRILYSREFRRLSGVTQVARADEAYLYHDRLSHSLKVAQVGRRLAEYYLRNYNGSINIEDYLSPSVVETAALAHDLGHPPFGHAIEEKLDELLRCRGIDSGFEGNAQSFRIVTKTSAHKEKYPGLNLTRASLNAMIKYPWARDENGNYNKWGYYPSESESFEFARGLAPSNRKKSLEAEIMDWADDLAYAIHDLMDFYQSGLIPLDQILEGTNEREKIIDQFFDRSEVSVSELDAEEFLDELEVASRDSLKTPYNGTDVERVAVNQLSSYLIEKYLGIGRGDHLQIKNTSSGPRLDINPDLGSQIEFLKFMTRFYVVDNNTLVSQQRGQKVMIEEIFETMVDYATSSSKRSSIIPSPYRERLNRIDSEADEEQKIRIIVDFIASMTEQQVSRLYKRLTGHTPGSLHNDIIR
jgi:dGTPase